MEKNFFKEIDEIVQKQWKEKIFPLFKERLIYNLTFHLNAEDTTRIFKKYINQGYDRFNIMVFESEDKYDTARIIYTYKNLDIKPNGYYILPKDSKYVDQLDIFRECVKQDTNTPDIKHLQKGD